MAEMVEALLEKDRVGRQGEGKIRAAEALVERYNFAGLRHRLRYYSTPQRLSFPTVRDP